MEQEATPHNTGNEPDVPETCSFEGGRGIESPEPCDDRREEHERAGRQPGPDGPPQPRRADADLGPAQAGPAAEAKPEAQIREASGRAGCRGSVETCQGEDCARRASEFSPIPPKPPAGKYTNKRKAGGQTVPPTILEIHGRLVDETDTNLDYDVPDVGLVRVPRASIREMRVDEFRPKKKFRPGLKRSVMTVKAGFRISLRDAMEVESLHYLPEVRAALGKLPAPDGEPTDERFRMSAEFEESENRGMTNREFAGKRRKRRAASDWIVIKGLLFAERPGWIIFIVREKLVRVLRRQAKALEVPPSRWKDLGEGRLRPLETGRYSFSEGFRIRKRDVIRNEDLCKLDWVRKRVGLPNLPPCPGPLKNKKKKGKRTKPRDLNPRRQAKKRARRAGRPHVEGEEKYLDWLK